MALKQRQKESWLISSLFNLGTRPVNQLDGMKAEWSLVQIRWEDVALIMQCLGNMYSLEKMYVFSRQFVRKDSQRKNVEFCLEGQKNIFFHKTAETSTFEFRHSSALTASATSDEYFQDIE